MNINPDNIIIGLRAREVGDISALVHSIESTGVLIHPPTVIKLSTINKHIEQYQLISGARRLAAVKELGWEKIPITVIPNISGSTCLLLELDENRRRESFKWQEEVVLKCNVFNEMRKTQPQLKQAWFAEEILGESAGMFSIELELFKGKDKFPEIMEIESLTKAREHLRKLKLNELIKEKQRRKAQEGLSNAKNPCDYCSEDQEDCAGYRAKKYEDVDCSGPHTAGGGKIPFSKPVDPGTEGKYRLPLPSYKIYPEAIEMLKSLPEGSIDCCVTDPPFGIEVQKVKHRSNGAKVYENNDNAEAYLETMFRVFHELNRVIMPGGHFYMFFSMVHYDRIIEAMRGEFNVWPHPLIWVKYNFNGSGSAGSCQAPYYLPAMTYHPILFCWSTKGARRTLVKRGEPNVIIHPPISPPTKDHPLSFPVDVYANLMTRSCYPGDTIIDPFCGTGNSIKAGLLNKFNIIASEKMERYRILAEEKSQKTIEGLEAA